MDNVVLARVHSGLPEDGYQVVEAFRFVPDEEPRRREVDAMTTVLLVRHADIDLPALSSDPPLNAAGRRRAAGLAHIAGEAGVTAVFTSTFTRTIQTVGPLVARLGQIAHPVPAPAVLAQQVTAGALGSVVVIAGHSNTIPEMIEALGVPAAPVIGEHEFDNLFVVGVVGGEAALLRLKYGKQSV
jgi:phosphohistidine phosphatase SixA